MGGSKQFGLGYNFPGFDEPSSKPILTFDPDNPATFLQLVDTINSYAGHAGKAVVVNVTEDGLTVSAIAVVSDKNHIHVQGTPATTWVVSHALAKFPAVSVVDAGGHEIVADVEYIDNATVNINFVNATAGTVYLN